jgi:predicted kinase
VKRVNKQRLKAATLEVIEAFWGYEITPRQRKALIKLASELNISTIVSKALASLTLETGGKDGEDDQE